MIELKLYPRHFKGSHYVMPWDCPIARAIKELHSTKEVLVDCDEIDVDDELTYLIDSESESILSSNFDSLKYQASKAPEDKLIHTVLLKRLNHEDNTK